LGLNACRIIADFLQKNKDFTHYLLDGNKFGDNGIIMISKGILSNRNTNLVHLDVSTNVSSKYTIF